MTSPWEQYFHINVLNSEKPLSGKIAIEMGASGWILVLRVNDERYVLASQGWRVSAFELAALIQTGAEKLQVMK